MTTLTCSVDVGQAVNVVPLDLSKAFDTVFHSLLLQKPMHYGLDKLSVQWGIRVGSNWLTSCTPIEVVKVSFPTGNLSPVESPGD